MTTTTSSTRRPAKPKAKATPDPVTREELERRTPGLFDYLAAHPDYRLTEAKLAKLTRPRWLSPAPSTAERAAGVHFDLERVDHFLRFARKCRHIKGRRFAGKPFVPDLWQVVWVLAPVFGWLNRDGTRRYRALFLEVPRKNGKSTLCAAIALYLVSADREPGAEVYSVARDLDQARAVFNVAANMVKKSPALRRRLKALIPSRTISNANTASEYKALASDRAGLNKHGLNVHGAIVDELHVITDGELIDTIETGTGSRDQPLIATITTAGIPEESPVWRDRRALAEKVSDGVIAMPDLLAVVFAADPACELDGSWASPAVWASANPGLGTSLRPDYLAAKAAEAKVSPTKLKTFLRLHLDVPTGSSAGWMPRPIWDRTAGLVDEGDLAGARCFGGLDLASSKDLAALVLVFPDEANEIVDVVCRFWTPADTLLARAHSDQADYEAWVKAGFLTATPGETIDYDSIEAELLALAGRGIGRFDVESVGYDPWGSKQLRTHLEDAGVPIWEVRQGFASLSPPMKETERLAIERRLRHGGHPVLRFCILNTVAAMDPAGNVKPDRKRSRSRIDGTAALVMAVGEWQRSLSGGRSAYEDHGLEVAR